MCIAPMGSECGSISSDKLGTVSNQIYIIEETARTSYAHTYSWAWRKVQEIQERDI